MKKQIGKLILASLGAMAYFFASSQSPFYRRISSADGLPSNAIYDMHCDRSGFMWFASSEGLCRYDGYAFKKYLAPYQTQVSGSSIVQDASGRIWYLNFDGQPYYVAHDSLKAFDIGQLGMYTQMGFDDSCIYAANSQGLLVIDVFTLNIRATLPIEPDRILRSFTDSSAYYVISKSELISVNKLNADTLYQSTFSTTKLGGQFALDTKQGLMYYSDTDGDSIALIDYKLKKRIGTVPFGGNKVLNAMQMFNNKLTLLTSNGFFVKAQDQEQNFDFIHYFPGKNVSDIVTDFQGNTWVSTTTEGVFLIQDFNRQYFRFPFSKASRMVQTPYGMVVGTENEELYLLDVSTEKAEKIYQGINQSEIYHLTYSPTTDLIRFSSTGFTEFNLGARKFIGRNLVALKDIYDLDEKYAAISSSGLSGFWVKNKAAASALDSLVAQLPLSENELTVRYVAAGQRGRCLAYNPNNQTYYFSTNQGTYFINSKGSGKITYQEQPLVINHFKYFKQNIFAADATGDLFLITLNNQVIKLAPGLPEGRITRFSAEKDFMLIAKSSDLYLANLNDPELRFEALRLSPTQFNMRDIMWQDGYILVLNNNGLVRIKAEAINESAKAKRFVIESIKLNDKTLSSEQFTTSKLNTNSFEINYAVLNYLAENQVDLHYRINNGPWQKTDRQSRLLAFNALAPGDYLIEFLLDDEIQSAAALSFSIAAPFYQQWWVVMLTALLLLGLFYAYYQWQISLLTKRNQLLTEKFELEQNLSKSTVKAIKSQMNPHFFFNALNTIQAFIFADDRKNASSYLSKFSRLTRWILEMSEKDAITLREEIEALKLYLELEKIRFNQEFEFEVVVDEGMDLDMIKIPTLLVQPYVENAIKHGLLHKDGNKQLIITIANRAAYTVITIDDNGIGRERSAQLNRSRQKSHEPFATKANEKRIELINKTLVRKISLRVQDKKDQLGRPSGTLVELQIPKTYHDDEITTQTESK